MSCFALPSFDPFSNAVGLNAEGTSYTNGGALYHQTNAFGEGWVLWNGGNGSTTNELMCVNSNLSYAGFPANFPTPSSTNAVLIPGLAQGVNAAGYSAALAFSRVILADTNNLVTNKIYASFLLQVPSIGDLATTGTEPIYFGGFNNSTAGDLSTSTPPGKSFKLFLQGNSSTAGSSTAWALGIADNSGGSTERFDPTFRSAGAVLFVVVDYEFGINGQNDNANLWVNPAAASFGANTPPAITTNITITSASGNEVGQAANFFLYNRGGATLWGSVVLSDLRIGTTWSFVTGGPEFTNQPASQTAAAGSTVTLNSAALAGGSVVSYQWRKNGTNLANGGNISGAANASLVISNVGATDAGNYSVVASDPVGSVTSSNAALSVNTPDPGIVVPPQSATIVAGGSAAFSVTPTGTSPFAFRWQFNGTNLFDGTLADGAVINGSGTSNLVVSHTTLLEAGDYAVVVTNIHGSVTSSPAILTVIPPLSITSAPQSRVEEVGDNLAFVVAVNNTAAFRWQFNGTNIAGATTSALALTNIQLTNAGTYTVVASNSNGIVSSSATLTVSTGLLHLVPTNLIVARVGDGVQALSSSSGNTLYLDQITTAGGYVSTLMVPNSGTSALIVPGTGDGIYESVLTLSENQQFINFVGYNVSYPYVGPDVTAGNVTVRGIAAVNGLGYYTLVLTNIGLYSGGGHFFRSAASTDGLTNFWTSGSASSAGIKYIAPGLYSNGQGIPALGGGDAGTHVAAVFQGSVYFSDSEDNTTQTGINLFGGLPTGTAATSLLFPTGSSTDPNDFAISPDGNTVYIADDNSIANGGGIQRWDFNQVQWNLSYTLGTGSNSAVGVRGLTVDFTQFSGDGAEGSGAIVYATTAESSGNRLISVADVGSSSPATVLDIAGPNQMLRGVRFAPTAAPVLVASGPQSQTVNLGANAVFSAVVTGSVPISYQWQFNGTNVVGATSSSLTVSNVQPANIGTYAVFVSNDISSTNAAATLSVLVNTNQPILIGAQSLGLAEVELLFSAEITPGTATNLANYTLTGPGGAVSLLSAARDVSGSNVFLMVETMTNGISYTVTASNIANVFATNNILPANSQTNFIASSYDPVGIGASQPLQTTLSNGFVISAVGELFNGTNDQAGFSGQLQTGNFDISVCLAGLGAADVWSEAGLMARQSLEPGSPFAASLATPGMSGCFFDSRSSSNGSTSAAGSFQVNIPNTWLRLSRAGSLFTGYASYDGQTWTQLGSATIAMTDPIYIGMAVTSNNTNGPTAAQFTNLSETSSNAVIGANPSPYEPIGPCSRKSGIVIYEIMYKPAPRADTNNCEYLEIYNTQPYFHDVSGYQITCADMNYTFPSNTIIPAGGFLVVAASPGSIQNVYGITNVMGPYTGSLKKSETLELLDEQSNILLTVPYSATFPWPVAADGSGHSIFLANPSYGEGDPRAWEISDIIGGSPGMMESYRPSPLRNVFIDEVLAHSENPAVLPYLKLYNHSAQTVDVSGCVLTDDTATNQFVIRSGTLIPPEGFVSFNASLGFTLNPAGDTVYFINPGGTRVMDALQFGGQADGVSFGRWPDGANDLYALQSRQPTTNNSAIIIGDIVINELMYDPISNNDDDQYIELYNQGSNTVSLANWQFSAGVTFTFPTDAAIGPNGYVVVAKNTAELFANYTNLNSGNTYGNYGGKLSHNGERVALSMPQTLNGTNTIYVVEDEVTYGTGGRWGQWSSGNGSSLELIDPHANHRLAANWTDSDDTQKSQWVTISNTGVLDNGTNYTSGITYAQVGLLDTGECLVDNVQVIWQGTNYITNSTFETGLGGWITLGDHVRSSLEPSGYQSSYSLHVRSSDKFWHAENSCETLLPANGMAAGDTVTLQFQARWLHGWPEPILHLDGNWLEAYGAMPVPANLGSPGQPNSTYVTNAGPAIYNVTHTPSLPAANQAAVVTAQIHDPDGVTNFNLYYRIDPATNYTAVPMVDNGTGGDAIAGDGVFSATIPGQAGNVLAAFYLSAGDSLGATTRFPALRPENNEPVRECLVLFGDGVPVSSLGTYHLWLTQSNVQRWISLADLGNEYLDCTFVNNNRVIYNMGGRFATSPAAQSFNSPVGNLCTYEWEMPDDDQFLGATSFHKIHVPGNGGLNDLTLQREQISYTFMRALGLPWLFRRNVALYVNGNRRGPLMEDTQLPDSDMVKEYFSNDDDGFLYKFDQWYEFAAQPSGVSIAYAKECTHTILPYTTTGGVKKVTRYRPMYQIRKTPDSMNDFTNIFSLVDAASSYGTPNYVANMENLANMENWMCNFAVNHAVGNWDVFGSETGQNLYGYIGAAGTKLTLMMWDMNIDLGASGSWGPGANLFTSNVNDTNVENIFSCPTFRRMYWRGLEQLINGQFSVAATAPLANAKYKAYLDDNLGAYISSGLEDPNTAMLPWIAQAQASIASQLAAVDAPHFEVNPTVTVSNDLAVIAGTAPVAVDTVWINGVGWPVTWTSLTGWTVSVPLQPGTNQFSITGVDIHGQPISGATGTATAVFQGASLSSSGEIVINEIMYDPVVTNAQYVELYNNSTTNTFDLSGWQLEGVAYAFPDGSEIGPNEFLILAANGQAFANAYGATIPVFDEFPGTLQSTQLLALLDANSNVVTEVLYESVAPWPSGPTTGAALELIDPTKDNWREGNWSGVSLTPGTTNSVYATMPAFPPLWVNEVQPLNINGITNNAGQHAPWLELYNPTTNAVALAGLYLTDTYTNLANWVFPEGSSIAAGQFLVVFADGQTNLSTLSELHTSFTLSAGSGSLALSRLYDGQPQVLDYLDYTNLPPNYSYGSYPDGQSFARQQFFYATPAAANNGSLATAVPYLALNSVYTQNFDSLPDPGATTVDSQNPVTINGITYTPANPLNFSASVAEGGLGLPALSGWFGLAASTMKVGASAGDQSTGGIISFGTTGTNSTNRALGLLATSSTGGTAFGLCVVNLTTNMVDEITLNYTGELWRQQPSAKTLSFSYYIDPTGTNAFTVASTVPLPAMNVDFPVATYSPEDGTQVTNEVLLSVTNQPILDCAPGAALWLVWQMTNDAGTSQGLAIDKLSFSADSGPVPPIILAQPQSQTNFSGSGAALSVEAVGNSALSYQWQFDGTNIAGATNSSLVLAGVTAANSGSYNVVVSDATGTNVSQPAVLEIVSHTLVQYTNVGAVYAQDFDSLPDPGATTVDTANPAVIDGVTYALPDPVDFGFPIQSSGTNGGLGLGATMPGWYSYGSVALKLGASAGDQTTGGIVSFGGTNGSATNRALGLLATSTSGATAFGVGILNQTQDTLTSMNLSFTGELWRQQTTAKSLSFLYYVDATGTNGFIPGLATNSLANLNVSFPTGSKNAGGTAPLMTASFGVTNQPITNCPPGGVLWLTWQMTSAASSAQGLAIDNLSFSATGPKPILSITQSNVFVILSWPAALSGYLLQSNLNLANPNGWQTVPVTVPPNVVALPITNFPVYFRLKY